MADKHVEDKFRDRLSSYEEEPGKDSWAFIESELPAQDRRWSIWWRITTAALLALLIGITTVLLLPSTPDKEVAEEEQITFGNGQDGKEEGETPNVGTTTDYSNSLSTTESEIPFEKDRPSEDKITLQKNPVDDDPYTSIPQSPVQGIEQVETGTTSQTTETSTDVINETYFASPYFVKNIGFDHTHALPGLPGIQPVLLGNGMPSGDQADVIEEDKKDLQNRKLALYFQAMPTFTYNRVEANQRDDQLVSAVEKIPAISTDRMGIRLETGLMYPLNEDFSVFAGLLYFQRSQEIEYSLQRVDSVNIETDGDRINFSPGYSEERNTYNHQLQNLGVQVGMTYNIPSNKVLSSFGVGAEFHKSLRRSSNELFEEPDLYLFYNVFYRVEYPKDKRFRFLAQPTFNYSFNLNKNLSTPFYIKPYGFGLNFGFTFKL